MSFQIFLIRLNGKGSGRRTGRDAQLQNLEDGDCDAANCSTLYLFTSDGQEHQIQGTQENISLNDVALVKTVGASGCYTIFKESNFTSASFCWKGNETRNVGTKNDGYEFAEIRCNFL